MVSDGVMCICATADDDALMFDMFTTCNLQIQSQRLQNER